MLSDIEIAQKIIAKGAGFISYFDSSKPQIFADTIHLNNRGSILYTSKLASDLKAINALGTITKQALPTRARAPMLWLSCSVSRREITLLPPRRRSPNVRL